MREITFRAWNGIKISESFGLGVMPEMYNRNEAPDLVFMQFTGLKDKNEVEIYEGYVLSVWEKGLENTKENYLVKWFGDDGYPAFDLEDWDNTDCNGLSEISEGLDYDCEVVGNIYENPELLKVAKDSQ